MCKPLIFCYFRLQGISIHEREREAEKERRAQQLRNVELVSIYTWIIQPLKGCHGNLDHLYDFHSFTLQTENFFSINPFIAINVKFYLLLAFL